MEKIEKLRSKVWNSINVMEKVTKGQSFTLPSMTIPDQTMSMRTIVDRFASGMPSNIGRAVIYEDQNDPTSGINPKTLDLADIEEMARRNKQTIEDLTKQVEDEREKRKQIHAAELAKKSEEELKRKWKQEADEKKPA